MANGHKIEVFMIRSNLHFQPEIASDKLKQNKLPPGG